jgi:hypothetical protein
MPGRTTRSLQDSQAGGITIIVTLMLLVLLTVAAMGMSKNSLREIAISGTTRQGSMARNVADSGIEWSTYWMYPPNATAATGTALALSNLANTLLVNPGMAGQAYDPTTGGLYVTSVLPTPPADTSLPPVNGTTQGFTVALTRMGKLPITGTSQGAGQGSFAPATGSVPLQAPDLWAIRSDSQVTTGVAPFAMTFFHSKESWVSSAARTTGP